MWPMLLDYSRDDCKRMLRRVELEAYSSIITAFRAQGDLNKEKRRILQDLAALLSISLERHRAEVRRAVNDERLNTIAHHMSGPNTSIEWTVEGRRLTPLLPRLVPQTAFTPLANQVSNVQATKNLSMNPPASTGMPTSRFSDSFDDGVQTKRRRIDSHSQMPIQGPPTIVPIKASQMVQLPGVSAHPPNHRIITTSVSPKLTSNAQRPFATSPNTYTISTLSNATYTTTSGVTPARVIFVSANPNSAPISSTTNKPMTAYSFRPGMVGSIRPPVQVAPNTRPSTVRSVRPPASSAVVIGVSAATKQVKSPMRTTTGQVNSAAMSAGTISFAHGSKIFSKTSGQQQVVVLPISHKSLGFSQSVKPVSSNAPSQAFIYQQGSSNLKAVPVQKVQTPNLIIMQPKQMVKSMKSPATTFNALTVTKSSAANALVAPKKTLESLKETTGGAADEKNASGLQVPVSTILSIQDSSGKMTKITAKKLQTNSLQDVADLSESEIITIDASNETLTGLINSFKSGQVTSELVELVKQAVEKEKDVSASRSNLMASEGKVNVVEEVAKEKGQQEERSGVVHKDPKGKEETTAAVNQVTKLEETAKIESAAECKEGQTKQNQDS